MYLCYHDTLAATNLYMRELISLSESVKNIAILANQQNYGVGKQGVAWQSFAGNVHLSISLPVYKYFKEKELGLISLLSSVVVREAVQKYLNNGIIALSKWPNDIIIQDAKIAGILIEVVTNKQNIEHYIIGIGVNLIKAPILSKYKTIALHDISKTKVSNLDFSLEIIKNLQKYLQPNYPYAESIISKWLEKAYKLGQEIKIKVANNFECGIFQGITSTGELILKSNNGIRLFAVGDIIF